MTSAGDWNRETSKPRDYDASLPITQEARIVVLGDPKDATNARTFDKSQWPTNAQVIATGTRKEELNWDQFKETPPTVVLVTSKGTRELLAELLTEFKDSIQWVHARSAGIEHCTSETLAASSVVMSNAKGHFSSTLAEYGMLACGYFAKDFPRLLKNQKDANWEKYSVLELRGATMGIVGYGDIGQATARLAKAYGMKVIALKRKRRDTEDPVCDEIYYSQENPQALNQLCAASDYIYVATPLTPETTGLIGKEQFETMKPSTVLINVGRGPVIDEEAMIEALKAKKIKGAGLDVFAVEPLPSDSPLWKLNNVLVSPHNMDQTDTFMQEGTDFFWDENLPRFLRGLPLYNVVDKAAGY